jgi:GMP synthase-like glutamine amidotransferase
MSPKPRSKVTRKVEVSAKEGQDAGDYDDKKENSLHLMMISCEDSPPYGPSENTANMFLDLLEKAYLTQNRKPSQFEITITVYEAKQGDYPSTETEWQSYDGILLPGSFSSAYETEAWIERLKVVIQSEIHEKCRKTMAVCFGHQVFAHSFSGRDFGGGSAVPCPASIQVGPFQFKSNKNCKWLSNDQEVDHPFTILYTHGDMVQSLPQCAISLGGTQTVPIQAAVYFSNDTDSSSSEAAVPYAFTFQGHPEYATDTGLKTFDNVLHAMEEKGKISSSSVEDTKERVSQMYDIVEEDSIHILNDIATVFRWF